MTARLFSVLCNLRCIRGDIELQTELKMCSVLGKTVSVVSTTIFDAPTNLLAIKAMMSLIDDRDITVGLREHR